AMREFALPDIAEMPAAGRQLIAPRIQFLLQSAPSGIFPFGLRRQTFSGPGAVSGSVIPGNMHDRMVEAFSNIGSRSFGPPPAGAFDAEPPIQALQWPKPSLFQDF